ncbi:CaiB/BaiF CoA transferase family protein [Nocardia pseudobrasiliensis]|uniref:Crotonobetainyl-CoA:carnitine CoA-transferase CaiB-like acyl-CoA transferase n=1 Tax=Nocardia pseudobrasiliensis TaxID=45979 RepID=A0A370I2U8_9NOCA|nr:CoA transferase [Nocardia pseudobrasiliensis]RDI65067.1 crotonobetainyl-CoA:carnitine CoA-transferase CaiB-like acyl-CoA transferase [Nocardia pseudobrasiliensis]
MLNIGGTPRGPLSGVRIVDLSTVVMGPFATQILGDLGADVIRIEPPYDNARYSPGDIGRTSGMAPLFLNVNRNKRSIALNLKDEGDLAALFELLENSDVFVTNMRLRALDRLGLGYDQIRDRFPALVYAHAQGFDPASSQSDRPAYDEVIQAVSGLVNLQERATGTLQFLPTFVGDKVASLYLAIGVVAALYHRSATGIGQRVEVPMADALISWTAVEHLAGDTYAPATAPAGNPLSLVREHAAMRTKDGAIAAVAYTYQDIKRLLIGAGQDELAAEPHWDSDELDVETFLAGLRAVLAHSAEKTTAEWESYLRANDMPYGVVVDVAKLADDPYVQEMGLVIETEHPTEGVIKMIANPLHFSETPVDIRRHAERPGHSTEEVLSLLR